MFSLKKTPLPTVDSALKGRDTAILITAKHHVLDTSMQAPYPEDTEQLMVGLGCFWGAEKKFWALDGIHTTAVGYSAGYTPNPSYEEVCSGHTGHNEVVLIVYKPHQLSLDTLLKTFWESHNPTQGMRQGNDKGTQYRSGIYCFSDAQKQLAEASKHRYQAALAEHGQIEAEITTEIIPASPFYFADTYHQQYLSKNPNGYCGLGGLGVCF
ncbi:MAG: peptide-methionine (S)-S-oxide reductase [Kiritimatiellia bacterium]|jgi:peptide-methionine (S)-S-oxide reductase